MAAPTGGGRPVARRRARPLIVAVAAAATASPPRSPLTRPVPAPSSPPAATAGDGSYLRSAEMEYVSLMMQEHLAHDVIERLGELGTVQFTDLNGDLTAFKRHYTPLIRKCDEMEKKLKFFEDEMRRHGIEPEGVSQAELGAWLTSQRESLARENRGTSLLEYWEQVIADRFRCAAARSSACACACAPRRAGSWHAQGATHRPPPPPPPAPPAPPPRAAGTTPTSRPSATRRRARCTRRCSGAT